MELELTGPDGGLGGQGLHFGKVLPGRDLDPLTGQVDTVTPLLQAELVSQILQVNYLLVDANELVQQLVEIL